MAKRCDVCGVGPVYGNNRSHANNKTRRRWNPNLQPMRVLDETTGKVKRIKICTGCISANKVRKYVRTP